MLAHVATPGGDRATWLCRWWAIAGLVLFAATWKLWTPQTVFPQVPLFGWAGSLPLFLDWLLFVFLMGALTTAAWKPNSPQSWVVFAVLLGMLIVLNQHRLQPWAWQLLLMAILFSSLQASRGRQSSESLSGQLRGLGGVTLSARLLRILTVSIYFWSAISKLDAEFVTSHGQTLIESLLRSVGFNTANWPASVKSWLAILLPVGELLIAVGLCWPRTRRAGLIAAIALHLGLILTLGPLGLGHRPGVLLWNVAFIGHDWLLFGTRAFVVPPSGDTSQRTTIHLNAGLRTAIVTFACLWPIAERWKLCDRWLAWSVYAARSERVSVTLTDEGLRRLPESAQRGVVDGELPLDRWSLAVLDVPIYPQLRFQFGVVEWMRQRCGEENLVEVIVQQGVSGIERLTIEDLGKRRLAFWINSQPRAASLANIPP